MLNRVKRFFGKIQVGETDPKNNSVNHDIRVATCALLVEIARIDETFSEDELELLLSILKDKYGLPRNHAEDLIAEAEKELEKHKSEAEITRLKIKVLDVK